MYLVKLNENAICVSEQESPTKLDGYLEVDGFGYLGKKYNNGVWEEVPQDPIPQQPTEQEIIQAELMLNQAQILANQQSQDEVLATILLEQARGQANV